jgi:lactose/L-arabinose transport system substrate-binding protein
VVLANSRNPDAAFDFLDKTFAGSVELFETILESSGAISTWLPAGNSPVYAKPNEFFGGQKIFEDLVSYAGKVPMVKYGVFNYEARDAAARALVDVVQGKSIDEALDTAHRGVAFLMGN